MFARALMYLQYTVINRLLLYLLPKNMRIHRTLYFSGSVTRSAKMFLARSWLAASPMMYSITGRAECWNNEPTVTANFACSSRLYSAFVNVIATCKGITYWLADATSLVPERDSALLSMHSLPRHTSSTFASKCVEYLRSDANTNNAHSINKTKTYFRLLNIILTQTSLLTNVVLYHGYYILYDTGSTVTGSDQGP